jgi:3-oxoadipate enol-lactonase/4-carboxymuconolactone decarboxylase
MTPIRGSLSQIKVPTLVIAGEEDRVTPPQESEILAKGISSTLSLIPGAGHFSMLDTPVAFNRILRSFLDGLARSASKPDGMMTGTAASRASSRA